MTEEADKPKIANRLSKASETELGRLVAALELDEALARVEERRERRAPRRTIPIALWVAIIGVVVPTATATATWVYNQGLLNLERERFASDRTLELLRLALDERMPEAMRKRILDALSSVTPEDSDAVNDPLIQRIASGEKQRVADQLATLEEDKKSAEKQVAAIATKKTNAERELDANPVDPTRAKKVELIQEQYDEQRFRLDHLKFRLGEGGPPPVREAPVDRAPPLRSP